MFLFGLLAAWVYGRIMRVDLGPLHDASAPGLTLGIAVGRWGCFLNGCCWGAETTSGMALSLPDLGGHWAWRYPTQLLESLYALALFLIVMAYRRRKPFVGSVYLVAMTAYFAGRFLEAYWRGDNYYVFPWLAEIQLYSLIIVSLGIARYAYLCAAKQRAKRRSCGCDASKRSVREATMKSLLSWIKRWGRAHESLGHLIAWAACGAALFLGGMNCSSGWMPMPRFGLPPSETASLTTVSRDAFGGRDVFEVAHRWDVYVGGPQSPARCQRLSGAIAQGGYFAIRVPDVGGAGRISRDPGQQPCIVLLGTPGHRTRITVTLEFRDDYLPSVNRLFPVAPGEQAHWECLWLSGPLDWDCSTDIEGELHYMLDLAAPCSDCVLETALMVDGYLPELPFYLPGWTHCLARYRNRLWSPGQQRSGIDMPFQCTEWVESGLQFGVCHGIENLDAQARQVDLSFTSSQGLPFTFLSDWNSTIPITSVAVGPRGIAVCCLKGVIPTDTVGLGTVIVTATVRSDPAKFVSVVDNFGLARDWSTAYPVKFADVPLVWR